jgi:pimeloyl-ACP methyl ester carboxylesterase
MSPVLLGISMWLGLAASVPKVGPSEFQEWFGLASRGKLCVPEDVRRVARSYRYVFVGGLGNEHLGGYFSQNTAELRALGVPRQSIHVINPRSSRTVEDNGESVHEQFCKIAATGPERLVVIAHSRGACDALAFALRNPRFVRERVRAVFLVQGPFGGTGLADYVCGEGKPVDGKMPPVHRFLARQIGKRVVKVISERGWDGAVEGLRQEESRDYWERTLREHAAAIPIVGPKVYYVESQADGGKLVWFHKTTGSYLRTYYGPNDGLVALADQRLPGLGTSLGPIDAGHTDLTSRFPLAAAGRRHRKALVQCVVMTVGLSPDESGPARPEAHVVARPVPR